jgi:hypothetical protein
VVCTSTVSSRGALLVDTSAGGEDFSLAIRGDLALATSGDLYLATCGDFFMATDKWAANSGSEVTDRARYPCNR